MTPGRPGTAFPLVVVLGPTAVGKSEIACHLARHLSGWILCADSMTVYQEMDIGTSKPSAAVQSEIPHRGLDLVCPGRDFSLGDYLRAANHALEEMRAAGAIPILVGGTGLYIRGVLKGIAELPPRDPAFRESLLERQREEGEGALYRLLQETDAASASRISPRDTQRVVRALELAREGHLDALGKPGREWRGPDRYPNLKVGLRRGREEMKARVNAKVDSFFARGLVGETRRLLAKHPSTSNAFKALGYREVAAHLRGDGNLEVTRQLIVRNTLRYAKRQMTWFRKEPQVRWFELSGPTETAAPRIRDHVVSVLGRMTAAPE